MHYIVTNAYFVTNKSYIVLIFIAFNCGYIYVCCCMICRIMMSSAMITLM